jgi:hypothetical protein
MKATNKLRFVERKVYVSKPAYNSYGHQGEFSELVKKMILQQWWEDSYVTLSVHVTDREGNTLPSPSRGEWRDVPVEVEA